MNTIFAAVILMMAQPPSSASKASGGFDPCALMTRQEAAAAVGEAVGEPKPIVPGSGGAMPGVNVTACAFTSRRRGTPSR